MNVLYDLRPESGELIRDYKVASLMGFRSRAFSNHRKVVDCKIKATYIANC